MQKELTLGLITLVIVVFYVVINTLISKVVMNVGKKDSLSFFKLWKTFLLIAIVSFVLEYVWEFVYDILFEYEENTFFIYINVLWLVTQIFLIYVLVKDKKNDALGFKFSFIIGLIQGILPVMIFIYFNYIVGFFSALIDML